MTQHVSQGQAPEQGATESVSESTMETVALAAKTVVEGLTAGIVGVDEAPPTVTPLVVALKFAKEALDGVKRHKERLEELYDRCTMVTTYVIIRCKSASSKIDIGPLETCVEEVRELAARCSIRGMFAKIERYQESDRIEGLRRQIKALVPTMGLGGVARVSEQVESVQNGVKAIADVLKASSTENEAITVSGGSGAFDTEVIASLDNKVLLPFGTCRPILADCSSSVRFECSRVTHLM